MFLTVAYTCVMSEGEPGGVMIPDLGAKYMFEDFFKFREMSLCTNTREGSVHAILFKCVDSCR